MEVNIYIREDTKLMIFHPFRQHERVTYVPRVWISLCVVILTITFITFSEKVNNSYVVMCPAKGMVDDGMKVVIQRAIAEANKGAKAFILEVDTPGGLVDSAVDITNILMEAKCPTIAYIHGMGAISAGALISYACKHIAMAPGSNIGASAPIVLGEAQPSEEFNEKTKSYLRSRYRTLAEVNGHNPLLAEAMVDAKIEVWGVKSSEGKYEFYRTKEEAEDAGKKSNNLPEVEQPPKSSDDVVHNYPSQVSTYRYQYCNFMDNHRIVLADEDVPQNKSTSTYSSITGVKQICREGELLTLTSKEALEYGLSEVIVENVEDLLKHYQLESCEIVQIEPTWGERVFKFLVNPMVAGILLLLGIGGLYLELKTPGFGLPGIIGITCLALFFGSHLVIGLANWIDLLLLLTGLILLGIEIFIIPGFGITGVSGLVCIIIGIYLSLTRVAIPEYPWDFARLENAGQSLTIAFVSFLIFVWLVWKYLPRTSLFQRFVLSHAENVEAGYVVQELEQQQEWIGAIGIAETVLRPAGKGRFKGQSLDVVATGEYIEMGTHIQIIEVQGNRYVVVPVKTDKEAKHE
ncbi:MAG: ATP-dependent Clp protease proteolytic subunit [Candidatus Hydrogenedens sp.]|nr:ATP-dependent Clp protease proteolytic subunit [Candidatus Hydrogenedens sp.]